MMLQKKTQKKYINWQQIPDHPYRILIIGGSQSGETNSIFNQIIHQADNVKMHLNAKDSSEAKYQLLINN